MALVERIRLAPGTDEYEEVAQLFMVRSTTKHYRLEIHSIDKVCNDSHQREFYLKKQEYQNKFGHVRTEKLFHGTKNENVSSILQSNLDVKRHGQHVGQRFGAGVSFSAQASYASHYCDDSGLCSMLLCNVLISNIQEFAEDKKNAVRQPDYLPGDASNRYDTTAKNKSSMDVIVKFENHSYYPAYVILFKKVSFNSYNQLPTWCSSALAFKSRLSL